MLNKVKLREIATINNGFAFKGKDFTNQGVPVIKIKNVKPNKFYLHSVDYVPEEVAKGKEKWQAQKGDILLTLTGNRFDGTPDSWVGKACMFNEDRVFLINQRVCAIRTASKLVLKEYLLYFLSSWEVQLYFIGRGNSSGGQVNISPDIVYDLEVPLPDLETQKKIAYILRNLDEKICVNSKIIYNLIEQVSQTYVSIFEDNKKERKVVSASDYFDITIGKTPPRKEFDWFSTSSNDVKWVSIADMGASGVNVFNTSERLTHKAIERFNVVVVPENTVLLSFKLTVGRVSITTEAMATNEAIAHFKTSKTDINPYLYFYLKRFKYSELGSTSSIATAINSKIVKAMPFVIPNNDELSLFNKFAIPAFEIIKKHEEESLKLEKVRDLLIPKLISGDLDLTNVIIEK